MPDSFDVDDDAYRQGETVDDRLDESAEDEYVNDDDGDFYEDDFYYDDSEDTGKRRKKNRLRLFCFHCNRPEGFFHANRGKWLHSYFAGLTFGASRWIGPFKCRCCGHRRYLKTNRLHPKMWIKNKKYG